MRSLGGEGHEEGTHQLSVKMFNIIDETSARSRGRHKAIRKLRGVDMEPTSVPRTPVTPEQLERAAPE
jgi:hypothetical protein